MQTFELAHHKRPGLGAWLAMPTGTLDPATATRAVDPLACYPSPQVPQISMMVVRALVGAVARAGVERSSLLAEAGLAALPLDDAETRIPLEQYRKLVRTAYGLSRDAAFGLHMGERLSMGSFDVLGHLVEHGASLRDAILLVLRYSCIVTSAPRLQLVERGEIARFLVDLPEENTPESRMTAEFSMVAFLRVLRSFIGEGVLPRRVLFTHPRPAHGAEYTRLFGGREQFSCEKTGMEFQRAWLDRSTPLPTSELRDYMLTRAEFLLAKADQDTTMRQRVERWLESQSDLSRPSLERVARDLRTSTRSLRRRLSEERVQFSALVDAARAAHARRMLLTDRRTIQDTAYALGFRTPSAFSRAFKRWTGLTPKAYRAAR